MNNIYLKSLLFIGFLFAGSLFPTMTNNFFALPEESNFEQVLFVEQNSISPVSDPFFRPSEEPVKRVYGILTAYSSSIDETSGDPFITASGQKVRTGVIANNCLPFGTLVEINGIYFEVLDRKNARYGCEWFDIWKPDKTQAINFGIQKNYINIILEN